MNMAACSRTMISSPRSWRGQREAVTNCGACRWPRAIDRLIDSPIADIKNVGPREGGSITAAQFLARFVDEGVPLGPSRHRRHGVERQARPTYDKGATGYGVRVLDSSSRTQPRADGRRGRGADAGRFLPAWRRTDRGPRQPRRRSCSRMTSGCWSLPRTRLACPSRPPIMGPGRGQFLPHGIAGGADDARQPILLRPRPTRPTSPATRSLPTATGASGIGLRPRFLSVRRRHSRWRAAGVEITVGPRGRRPPVIGPTKAASWVRKRLSLAACRSRLGAAANHQPPT